MIKGQDIVVLAVLMEKGAERLAYAELGKAARVSASEAHAAVKRLQEALLLNSERCPVKGHVEEFLIHGLRYSFPLKASGKMTKGMPTSYAAPVAAEAFAVSGQLPVWEGSSGTVYGKAYLPIYSTAPAAAAEDERLYARLAVMDMLRSGRLRERQFAEKKLREWMA